MAPNNTDLKVCVEIPECGQSLLTPQVKEQPPAYSNGVSVFRTTLPQVLATMAKSMLLLALGMLVGAPTVVIAALREPDSHQLIRFSNSQASWFAGILLIMQPTGSVIAGFAQDLLGRKKCMMLVNLPQLAGWLLIRYATSVEQLFLAALLMGFTIGFMEAPTLSYVGEISQPHLRGILASFTSVYVSSGLLIMYLLASLTDYRSAAALSCTVPIITFIAISQVPESPVWLILKGRDREAEQSLCWLRGWTTPDNVAKEFATLREHLLSSKLNYAKIGGDTARPPTTKEKLLDFCRPAMLKPLLLSVLYFGFAHAAANNGARPYLYSIYRRLGVPIDPFLATVVSSATQILGSVVCMVVVRRLGKRKLSLISMLASSSTLLCLGTYSSLEPGLPWLPLVLMSALTFATNAGIGVIPWALLSEIFPPRGRGMGGGMAAATYYIWFFIFSKTWLDLESVLQLNGMFFFYGSIGFVGFLFLYFCLPETEGKTLEEVEEIFKKKCLRR